MPPRPPAALPRNPSRILPPAAAALGPVAAIWLRRLRAARRAATIVLWTLASAVVQAILLQLPGRAKRWFPTQFWGLLAWLLGLQVQVLGKAANRTTDGRAVVFAANHSSWLDVAVIGARIEACFVSKDTVRHWPGVNIVAWLGRTVYVSRHRSSTGRESDVMRRRLDAGDDLVLFAEGTTADGAHVLPFRSSFLSVAEGPDPPWVQPVTIVYDRLAGLPALRSTRALFAYYGDMAIGRHFWRLVQCHGFRATMVMHAPLDPRDFADRKALTRAIHATVDDCAARLRQNRPIVTI